MRSRFATLPLLAASLTTSATAAAAPLFSGDLQIAADLLAAQSQVLVVGDSINDIYLTDQWLQQLNDNVLTGVDQVSPETGPNRLAANLLFDGLDFTSFGSGNAAVQSAALYTPGNLGSFGRTPRPTEGGQLGVLPGGGLGFIFNGNTVTSDGGSRFGLNTLVQIDLANINLPGEVGTAPTTNPRVEELLRSSGGNATLELYTTDAVNGLAAGDAVIEVYQGGTLLTSADLASQTNDGGLISQEIQLSGIDLDAGGQLSAFIRLAEGAAPTAGSEFILNGVSLSTSDDGFQWANLAESGAGVRDFASEDFWSDAVIEDLIDYTDTDIVLVWLGENDIFDLDAEAWKSEYETLIERIDAAAGGDVDFVLVSSYDTIRESEEPFLQANLAEYAEVLSEITEAREDTLFLNLYEDAGDFAALDAQGLLLPDGGNPTHPTELGSVFFVGRTLGLAAQAQAAIPEPTTAAIAGLALLGLAGRRRRA